jgi:outer membrane biosynthesis protein TonB
MNRSLETLRLQVERAHQRRAAGISSALFLAVLALCFFLTAYSISIPPPGEQYVAVGLADFGEVDAAAGENETEVPSEEMQEVVEESVASSEAVETPPVEEVVTQAESEVAVPTSPDPVVEETDEEPDEPEQTVSTALSNAFSALSAGGGGSQGTASQGTGNEGNPEGDMFESGTTVGNLTFGISDGGEIVGWPKQEKDPSATGVVRMKLTVDSEGKVLTAKYDPENSTLTESYNIQIAHEAALTTTFTPNPAMPRRTAYIEFHYELE